MIFLCPSNRICLGIRRVQWSITVRGLNGEFTLGTLIDEKAVICHKSLLVFCDLMGRLGITRRPLA
jgi:hypothetical protein